MDDFHQMRELPARSVSQLIQLACFHSAQPVIQVHFRYSSGADQVGDKTHDFGQLCVHKIHFLMNYISIRFIFIIERFVSAMTKEDICL